MVYNEKFRINCVNRMPMYDANAEKTHYIIVCEKNKKYGIIDQDARIFIPFVFDNISIIGFGMLLVSKGGKVGLLHIEQDDYGQFGLRKFIVCLYDIIDTPNGDNVFFLRKYQGNSIVVRAYLRCPSVITAEYSNEIFVPNWISGNDYLEMSSNGESTLFDTTTGKVVTEYGNFITVGGYPVGLGIVLHQISSKNERLLYIPKGRIVTSYIYSGEMTVALTALEDGNPRCYGFIVINNDKIVVLNEFCKPLDFLDSTEISVKHLISNEMLGNGTKTMSIDGFNLHFEV